MSDLTCDHCDETFGDEREKTNHVLEKHDDDITSHKRDELKRKRNKLTDQSGGTSFDPAAYMKPALGVLLIVAVIGGAYVSGLLDVSTGSGDSAGSNGGEVTPGAPGTAHEHAQFDVVIDGEAIDFSRPRYQVGQTQNRYIHFEGGDGQTIHKHAKDTTIAYALESVGMSLGADCLQLDTGEQYCEDSGNLTVQANGNGVNASSYVIQDGDTIEVSYSSN